jgi:hypothetical protein
MKRRAGLVATVAFYVALTGCEVPHQNVIMLDGKASGVIIQYYGDVNATLPLARQHCAAYERVPVRKSYSSEKNLVIYDCVAQ